MHSALALIVVAVVTAAAAEPDLAHPVDVPDPVGLGERLAILDWLHQHHVETADDATIEDLRLAWLRATGAAPAEPPIDAGAEDAAERERLALELWRRHGRNAEPGETTAQLRERLSTLDREDPPADGGHVVDTGDDSPGSATKPAARAHAAKPVKTTKPAKPAKVDAATPPPLDDEHREAWANYAAPPTELKGDVEFRLYVLASDDHHVYLWTDNRSTQKRTAELTIGGAAHIARIYVGTCRQPYAIAVDDPAHAALVVGAVDGRAAHWDILTR